ncbi:hypothetical protein GLOTRDRAFT_126599 [Gloeophyllum trabeum ATCC 11539]|uniref:Uncharacterized protein n=1 Tax=Gloeophyllum trabeum (strain ATCC 11539 / FP-39264 / Madison 617) TaxID=670483 RepID=S7RZ48_GLOTA|nr:uncharacterized protein GLOTRDRAFT_126599 [Gloeophyllum trabeum ATCC 11539]EPQ58719.1 hypothetical protein GLOTRDRAFT_126599 [Gloeophyllum trabeum ATCC 11539]
MPPPVSKPSLKPKRHHFYQVFLFILGTLFPPLAVAARFGIGGDFFLNLILTICGYIPGHAHNFYIQNIRNNKNHRRTPKWAQRYGLIDTSTIQRHQKRSEWAQRYNERLPHSALQGQPYEEGERGSSSIDVSLEGEGADRANNRGEFWRPEDEQYYGQRNGDRASVQTAGSSRWHYPANFEDTIPVAPVKKKKVKKDRFARTEDAYNMPEEGRKKRKKKRRSTVGETDSTYSRRTESTSDFPEDAEGGLYGDRPSRPREEAPPNGRTNTDEELFTHEF